MEVISQGACNGLDYSAIMILKAVEVLFSL